MPEYDVVIRGGTVVDGTGMPGVRADVGIAADRIARIGRIRERGRQEVDAEGHVVTPGFVDGHTHMDAQVFWDAYGTSSCWHGVTTVVMGNCGLTLAPLRSDQQELLIRNLEGVEDIPGAALAEGVPFGWEHFSEYLDALEKLPKAINFAGYVGHSALRTWAMGERAFEQPAEEDDVRLMADGLRDALRAGAMGFTTSRSANHTTSDGRPVASRMARWDEVATLVDAMFEAGGGIFELSNESVISSDDPDARQEYTDRLRDLAVSSGLPVTFGVTGFGSPHRSRALLSLIDATAAAGGTMFGQSLPMPMTVLYSFRTRLPFRGSPTWREWRACPPAEQVAALRRPEERGRLVEAAHAEMQAAAGGRRPLPGYDQIHVLREPLGPNPTLAEVAAQRDADPVDTMIDLALESDFDQFFYSVAGNGDPDEVRAIAEHPRVVMTFTDSGAHVGSFIYSSMHSRVLADWVRRREVFTLEEAVRMMTLVPATAWNLADRGLVREGFVADLNVFDPEGVAPEMPSTAADLPGGLVRLVERAQGFRTTLVAGQVVLRDGEPAGPLPGRLLRRRPPR